MNKLGEVSRVNYANTIHHKEKLHHMINPHMIEQIECCQQPNRNYRNVKKIVYHDQLQKTIAYHEEKKAQVQHKNGTIFRNLSAANMNHSALESINGELKGYQNPTYTDYDQENNIKKHVFIEKRNLDGCGFFKSQDQYQLRKQQEANCTREALQQQLQQKEEKKLLLNMERSKELENLKENRQRQVEMQLERNNQKKMQLLSLGKEIQQQAEVERKSKQRKSIFSLGHIGKHNPITNPIEEHMDNPYILKSYQDKAYHC